MDFKVAQYVFVKERRNSLVIKIRCKYCQKLELIHREFIVQDKAGS